MEFIQDENAVHDDGDDGVPDDSDKLLRASNAASSRIHKLQETTGRRYSSLINNVSYKQDREKALSLLVDCKTEYCEQCASSDHVDSDTPMRNAVHSDTPMNLIARTTRQTKNSVSQPFPVILHKILRDLDERGYKDDIASWLPHGKAFIIQHELRFVAQLLPIYFRQSRLAMFQRNLELYGFMKIISGPDKGAYFHPLFLKDRPDLAASIPKRVMKKKQ